MAQKADYAITESQDSPVDAMLTAFG